MRDGRGTVTHTWAARGNSVLAFPSVQHSDFPWLLHGRQDLIPLCSTCSDQQDCWEHLCRLYKAQCWGPAFTSRGTVYGHALSDVQSCKSENPGRSSITVSDQEKISNGSISQWKLSGRKYSNRWTKMINLWSQQFLSLWEFSFTK